MGNKQHIAIVTYELDLYGTDYDLSHMGYLHGEYDCEFTESCYSTAFTMVLF